MQATRLSNVAKDGAPSCSEFCRSVCPNPLIQIKGFEREQVYGFVDGFWV